MRTSSFIFGLILISSTIINRCVTSSYYSTDEDKDNHNDIAQHISSALEVVLKAASLQIIDKFKRPDIVSRKLSELKYYIRTNVDESADGILSDESVGSASHSSDFESETDIMEYVEKDIHDQKTGLRNLLKLESHIGAVLGSAVDISGKNSITETIEFKTISVNGFVVKNPEQYRRFSENTAAIETRLDELDAEFGIIENSANVLRSQISRVAMRDEPTTFKKPIKFHASVVMRELNSSYANIVSINHQDVMKVMLDAGMEDLVYNDDGSLYVIGNKTFTQPILIRGNLSTSSSKKLNGINIDQYVTTKSNQVIKSEVVFNTLHANDLKLKSEDFSDLILIDGDGSESVVQYAVQFEDLDAANVKSRGNFNGYNLSGHLLGTGNQWISSDLEFKSKLTVNNMKVENLLNGVSSSDLSYAIKTNERISFRTNNMFDADIQMDEIELAGHINSLRTQKMLLENGEQLITGKKYFLNVSANDVTVDGTVDGLNFADDVVRLSTDDVISSPLLFVYGLNSKSAIETLDDRNARINGYDVSYLRKLHDDVREELYLIEEFKQGVVTKQITVTSMYANLTNGIDLPAIDSDAIHLNDPIVEITGRKIFNRQIKAESCQFEEINGVNASKLIDLTEPETIESEVEFLNDISFTAVHFNWSSDLTENLAQLSKYSSKSIFKKLKILDHLSVNGYINGIDPDEFVTKFSNATILYGKKFDMPLKVSVLDVNRMNLLDNTLDGIDLFHIEANRIDLNSLQTLDCEFQLENATVDQITLNGLLNDIDFNNFAENILRKSADQEISGQKTFLNAGNSMTFNHVATSKGLNNISLNDLNWDIIKMVGQSAEVTTEIVFKNDVTVDGQVWMDSGINSINFDEFISDSVYRDSKELQVLQGNNKFMAGLKVVEDSSIASIRMRTDDGKEKVIYDNSNWLVLTHNNNDIISGTWTIGGDMEVSGNITGRDADEIEYRLKLKSSNFTSGNLSSPICQLDQHLTWLDNGTSLIIHTDVVFTNINASKVNGITVDDLILVNSDETAVFTGSPFFEDATYIDGDVTVVGSEIIAKRINGVTMNDLIKNTLTTNGNNLINGRVTFKDNFTAPSVNVFGAINGCDLEYDFANLNKIQTFEGRVTFEEIDVQQVSVRRIHSKKLGVEFLSNEFNQTEYKLLNHDKLRINAVNVTVNSINAHLVNGKRYFASNLLQKTDQYIAGTWTFNDVYIESNLNIEEINGIRLPQALDDLYLPVKASDQLHRLNNSLEHFFDAGKRVDEFLEKIDRKLETQKMLIQSMKFKPLISGRLVREHVMAVPSYKVNSIKSPGKTTLVLDVEDPNGSSSSILCLHSVMVNLSNGSSLPSVQLSSDASKTLKFTVGIDDGYYLIESGPTSLCRLRPKNSMTDSVVWWRDFEQKLTSKEQFLSVGAAIVESAHRTLLLSIRPDGDLLLYELTSEGIYRTGRIPIYGVKDIKSVKFEDEWYLVSSSPREMNIFKFNDKSFDPRLLDTLSIGGYLSDTFVKNANLYLVTAVGNKNMNDEVIVHILRGDSFVEWQKFELDTHLVGIKTLEHNGHQYMVTFTHNQVVFYLLGGSNHFEMLSSYSCCTNVNDVHLYEENNDLYLVTAGDATNFYRVLMQSETCPRNVKSSSLRHEYN